MTISPDHVLLTRFNLPTPGVEQLFRAKEGWLKHRVSLFEQVCAPSVQAQSDKTFQWIVFFDPESPEWLRNWVTTMEARGLFRPIYRKSVNRQELVEDIRTVTGAKGQYLITTNLDNDDGIARDFVGRIKEYGWHSRREALYLSQGLILSAGRVYLRRDERNAFCSVLEDWDDPRTCWADWHNLLGQSMQESRLEGEPAWLQVVHGSNVSNRVHGQLTNPETYRHLFPGVLEDLRPPARPAIVMDRMVGEPLRTFREGTRKVAKATAFRTLGKDGLDRAKLRYKSLRVSR
jgi:N-acetylglucosaminyl-diphospho-decaprenol L-rhamnosyltransferase